MKAISLLSCLLFCVAVTPAQSTDSKAPAPAKPAAAKSAASADAEIGIFRDLANQDYDRAVELARGFQAEGPRALATIAIARAVLEPKEGERCEKIGPIS